MIKHIKEFEYYYNLGSGRSYSQVAAEFKKSLKTVKKWGSVEKWQEETELRDNEAIKIARKRAILEQAERISRTGQILDLALFRYVEQLNAGKIKISSVKDLEKLIKLGVMVDVYSYVLEEENIRLLIDNMFIEEKEINKRDFIDSVEQLANKII